MNNESLNKWLAVEVMGWKHVKGRDNFWKYCDKNNKFIGSYHAWNPTENVEQALMCLGKHEQWGTSHNMVDDGYFVSIVEWPNSEDDKEWEAEHESLPMAISLACGRASGWEE